MTKGIFENVEHILSTKPKEFVSFEGLILFLSAMCGSVAPSLNL